MNMMITAAAVTTIMSMSTITMNMMITAAAAMTTMSMSIITMTTVSTAPAAMIIITITPTKSLPPGAQKPPRSTLFSRSMMRWTHWIPKSTAWFSVPRVSLPALTAAGSTLTLYPKRRMSVWAVLILPASSASSARSWMKRALPRCLTRKENRYAADPSLCIYRLPGFR